VESSNERERANGVVDILPTRLFPIGIIIRPNPRRQTQHLSLVLPSRLYYFSSGHSWRAMELGSPLYQLRRDLCDCIGFKES
jgi:hypothetical protein